MSKFSCVHIYELQVQMLMPVAISKLCGKFTAFRGLFNYLHFKLYYREAARGKPKNSLWFAIVVLRCCN